MTRPRDLRQGVIEKRLRTIANDYGRVCYLFSSLIVLPQLFSSQHDRGAEDNAVFYTLLVNCDNLNVPPLEWLTRTLERIRPDMDEDQLMALLPYNYKADAS